MESLESGVVKLGLYHGHFFCECFFLNAMLLVHRFWIIVFTYEKVKIVCCNVDEVGTASLCLK